MNKKNKLKRVVISVEGISCYSCASNIEKALKKIDGILEVSVYVVGRVVVVKYLPEKTQLNEIITAIKSIGYTRFEIYENEISNFYKLTRSFKGEEKTIFLKFIISAFVFIILLLFSGINVYLSFFLSLFVWGWCANHFHKGLWYALKSKTSDMNTLVSLSSTTMLFYTAYSVLIKNHSHLFHWHEISMLIAFINLGKYIELKTKHQLISSIEKLKSIFPDKAIKVINDEFQKEVKVDEIRKGDIILVKPGMEVPVDGKIIEGESYFNLNYITGEAFSVFKKKDDFVYAGSLNQNGCVKIKVVDVGQDTVIAKILKAVIDAQNIKLNVQKKVDKIASYFVPSVILVAIVSSVIWFFYDKNMAVNVFASVLAISCPCAMGLSVPIAVMVGLLRATRLGFVINNPLVIENFSKIDTVILDKTGTLTEGKMKVYDIKSKIDIDNFLRLLCSVEFNSEHIFAKSVLEYCNEKKIKPYKTYNFKNYPGKGVECISEKGVIIAGNPDLLKEKGIDFSADEKELSTFNLPFILLCVDNTYIGYCTFYDPLRKDAKQIIERFKKHGIEVVIASGDARNSVKKVADELEVKEYYSEIKPDEKQSIVLKYKLSGKKVMMIGDGINDSAALNEADIGVAMGSSKDAVKCLSDVVLISNDISAIFKVIRLIDIVKSVITQNLIWAFIYNIILIPVASGVFYNFGIILKPYMAAVAMAGSSISVVLNSLRIFKIRID